MLSHTHYSNRLYYLLLDNLVLSMVTNYSSLNYPHDAALDYIFIPRLFIWKLHCRNIFTSCVYFSSFYIFSIRLWNCADSVLVFVFHFISTLISIIWKESKQWRSSIPQISIKWINHLNLLNKKNMTTTYEVKL